MITKINISQPEPEYDTGTFDEEEPVIEECSDCGGEAMIHVIYRRNYITTSMQFDDLMCMACYSKPDFQRMLFNEKTETISVKLINN